MTTETASDVREILDQHPHARRDSLIPILQEVQEARGYLSREAIVAIGEHLGLPASKIYGVATFYNQFRFQPQGKYHIQVCRGTACHVKGSAKVLETVVSGIESQRRARPPATGYSASKWWPASAPAAWPR